MARAATNSDQGEKPAATGRSGRPWPSRWRWRFSLIVLFLLLFGLTAAWVGRDRIAANLIDEALAENGLEAQYTIESIGTDRQVLSNLVIGDPAAPDFVADRVIVDIAYSLGVPELGEIELINPRLYGSYREGKFSLGALDPLLFSSGDDPAGLPQIALKIVDGRARIDTDYGVIGIKAQGEGRLDDGFAGKIAATMPGARFGDCSAETVTLYGDIITSGAEPRFEGPVRMRGASCGGARVQSADISAALVLSADFSSIDAALDLRSDDLAYDQFSLARLAGDADLTFGFDSGNLTLRHDLAGQGLAGPNIGLAQVSLEGSLRAANGFERADWDAGFTGKDADLDMGSGGAFAQARAAASGTLLDGLLNKFERGLGRALRGGQLAGDVTIRLNDGAASVIIPEARLKSAGGETVLAVSRLNFAGQGERLSGNILTGGADLPQINGRMERSAGGDSVFRMTMAPYRGGADMIAIPLMEARQDRRGRVSFNGQVQAGGAIPGGAVRSLELPIEGTWSQGDGLALGRSCALVRIGGLTLAQLTLDDRAITLCPDGAAAMVRYRDRLQINMAADDLQLSGDLAQTPAAVTASRAVMRYPGTFEIAGLDVQLGADDNAVHLSAKALNGEIGDTIGGGFTGAAAGIDAMPLDLSGIGGTWAYDGGVLRVGDGSFVLTERTGEGLAPQARFEPLIASGAGLTLENGQIRADAELRHPLSGALVAALAISHDLTAAEGQAEIAVPGISFGERLQPQDLSYLARGVIALAKGTVRGQGEITWSGDDIQSSGLFSTDEFDFAAAFGPVRGVRGEIAFTDLIGMTTAPSQVLQIGSVNPGVEALDGRVVYSMTNGEVITVEDGRWPFMGGELILRPTTLIYGGREGQRYTFELVGLDAAVFVAQMELTNLGATGVFDGTIPIYFDPMGNGSIDGGLLISRQPGGNVSYVGELTYEDMGAMANYAFRTLRSLDYRQMSIELNGDLAGEILTNFNIDGVRQGDGASRNFITRELAKLPIRFKINVRSDNFYLLATIVRGLFDPTVFGNPIDQGLLSVDGGKFVPRPSGPGAQPPAPPPTPPPSPTPGAPQENTDIMRRDEGAVQPSESEDLP